MVKNTAKANLTAAAKAKAAAAKAKAAAAATTTNSVVVTSTAATLAGMTPPAPAVGCPVVSMDMAMAAVQQWSAEALPAENAHGGHLGKRSAASLMDYLLDATPGHYWPMAAVPGSEANKVHLMQLVMATVGKNYNPLHMKEQWSDPTQRKFGVYPVVRHQGGFMLNPEFEKAVRGAGGYLPQSVVKAVPQKKTPKPKK